MPLGQAGNDASAVSGSGAEPDGPVVPTPPAGPTLPAGPALIRLSTTIGERILAARSRSGLSAHQLQTLRLSVAPDAPAAGTTMSDVAGSLSVSRSTATSVVDQLVAAALVDREPDEADHRILRVRPTESGRRALDQFDADVAAAIRPLLQALGEDQRQRLHALLERLDPPTRAIPLA